MSKSFIRKPFSNFFIKQDLQVRLIIKIVLSVLIATVIFAGTLLVTYQITYKDASFYQVSLAKEVAEIGDRLEIVNIILPSMLISSIVNIVLAFFVGLYASRKYAVPIYKLEQWASLLLDGNMSAKLRFREKEEMRELSTKCNRLSDKLLIQFTSIKKNLDALKDKGYTDSELSELEKILSSIELESDTIEVHTTFTKIPENLNKKS